MRKLREKPWAKAQLDPDAANTTTNVEQDSGNEQVAKSQASPFDSPVHLLFRHYRHRFADRDGISVKAAIDGLVLCGILRTDQTSAIKDPIFQPQEKIPQKEEEYTEIEIYEA